ncbi:flagellar biosynthetic protein FliO [Clostridium uliginosum]|uniref:Flagellar protein FliO/FliZ n=1 Tax=Clostridium uliginosum TaxID=119641 RepID=A0A1I1KVG1_9CLOT|nr:flagellar biosynthetic protein FliO [Clostridium uliginosum]SFC61450.1 flagellar protein FliO/FliZ [Clostridium uliginosum]
MVFDFIKMCIYLSIILGLIFLMFRLLGSKINQINDKKYMKIVDKLQVTKENSLIVVKVGKRGYVMTSSSSHMEKLEELSEEEINIIEEDKKKLLYETSEVYNKFCSNPKDKFLNIVNNIRAKGDKHEK